MFTLMFYVKALKLVDSGEDLTAAATGLAVVLEQLGDVKEASRVRAQYRV